MPAHVLNRADWVKIYRKAFRDAAFMRVLETDPTRAVRDWLAEEYNDPEMTLEQVVDLSEWMTSDTPPIFTACC
jgi:hypothetical protein